MLLHANVILRNSVKEEDETAYMHRTSIFASVRLNENCGNVFGCFIESVSLLLTQYLRAYFLKLTIRL